MKDEEPDEITMARMEIDSALEQLQIDVEAAFANAAGKIKEGAKKMIIAFESVEEAFNELQEKHKNLREMLEDIKNKL